MKEYICGLCRRRLFSDEVIQYCDGKYGDLYVICPYCFGDCCCDMNEESVNCDEEENKGKNLF